MNGILAQDWKVVGATRTDEEQSSMAGSAGSCENAFAALMGDPMVSDPLKGVDVGDVRVQGNRAEVGLRHPGRKKPAVTFVATKVGDGWRLSSGD